MPNDGIMGTGNAEDGRRLYGFDLLRFSMVFCVIMLHSAMTYMAFVPEWWYVIDSRNSPGFTVLVVFLDSFPMSVLFFLAGYFAPFSLRARGRKSFLKQKLLRIGVPWALGVILVAPFFAWLTFRAYRLPFPGVIEFLRVHFLGVFYQQAQYWFLGTLLFFLLVFFCLSFFYPVSVPRRPSGEKQGPSPVILFAVFALTAFFYYLSTRFLMPSDGWINIKFILYFQPARFVGYAALFFLGASGWKNGWFTPEGWTPCPVLWAIVSSLSGAALLFWKFLFAPGLSSEINLVLDAIFYSVFSIAMTFFLTGLAARGRFEPSKRLKNFLGASYGIYWLHQIVLMAFLYVLLPLDVPIFFKWLVSLPVTVLGCLLLYAAVLKRLPLVGKAF